MEIEVEVYDSEIKNEQEVHVVDSRQRSIRSFFKPVACKQQKSLSSQGDSSRTDETVGWSLNHKRNSSVKGTAAENNIDDSLKSKKKKRVIEIEKIDISGSSIDHMEEEKDLLEQSKFIHKTKQKKSIKGGEQKNKAVLTNEGEKESKDPEILEYKPFGKRDKRELELENTSKVKKDIDFLSQNDCINLAKGGGDKMEEGKKSRRKTFKTGSRGEDEETITRVMDDDGNGKWRMMMEEEETAVVQVDKGTEFDENEVESMKETINLGKSESKENGKVVYDIECKENRLVEEPGEAIGKRRKKKILYDSEKEEEFMQKDMKADGNYDAVNASDFCGVKETEKKGMKRNNTKGGNEAVLEGTSMGDGNETFIKKSSMAKQAHMKEKNNRKGENLSLERKFVLENIVKSGEEKSSLNEEESLADRITNNNENNEDRETVKANKKNKSQINKKKVPRNTKEENKGESIQEIQQEEKLEEIVEEENALHGMKKKKSKKTKNIGNSSSDFCSRHMEEGAKESVVCPDKESDDESQVLNRRSRRQRMRAVNYADEFFSVEGSDDEDFYPQARKPRRYKVDKRGIEQKSNGEKWKRRMESKQVNENGSKQGNEKESIVHCTKGPAVPVAEDSAVNLKNSKALGEGSEASIQVDSKNMNLSAATCLKTNFLAKFTKQVVVKSEEIVVIKHQTALPCINHTLQTTDQEKEWYQRFLNGIKQRDGKSIKVNDITDDKMMSPVVTKRNDWDFLTNCHQTCKRIPGETTCFIPLDIVLAELSKLDLLVPVLKQLKVYVDCQMNVLKQCLAKVEAPKSNLKTIWEKEEKWIKNEVPSIQIVDTEPAKPAIDIRSMFTKAKSKTPRAPKQREDKATFSEEKCVNVAKTSEHNTVDCVKTKRKAERKSRQRRSREKEDDGKDRNVALDSSIEILSNDDADLKGTSTIQESFTKISNKRRHVRKKTENIDDEENCNSEKEELIPLRRQSSRRAALKNEITVDEDFISFDEEANNVASRGSRRERRRVADENEASNSVEHKDRDIAEDYSERKKRKQKKKKEARKGRGDVGSGASNDRGVPESGESHTAPSQSRRTKKSGKKVKDENLSASNEDVLENQVSDSAQYDIRNLFGSVRHLGKEKKYFEGKIEAKIIEQCETSGPSNDMILAEFPCNTMDEVKESLCIVDDEEAVVLAEQRPTTVDIRCLFRKSYKNDANNTRGSKESEACVADVSQTNALSTKVEVERSQKDRNFFSRKLKIAESLESKCDEKESNIPRDGKKKMELIEEKSRSSSIAIEEMNPGETKNTTTPKVNITKECGEGESAEDVEQRRVAIPRSGNDQTSETSRVVGAVKSIMSYFKPSARKLNECRSSGLELTCSPLISKSSTTKESKINYPDFTNGDIVKNFHSGDGENQGDCEKVTPLKEELQSKLFVEKQESAEVSMGAEVEGAEVEGAEVEGAEVEGAEVKSRRKLEISNEEISKYDKEVGKYGVLSLVDCIECGKNSENEDQNLEESVGTRTSTIHISPTATCARAKRKRVSASVMESRIAEEAMDECIEAKSESEMKLSKAKRVKIAEYGELKDISVIESEVDCKTLNTKVENLNLGTENRYVGIDMEKNGEFENYKESTSEDTLNLETMNFSNVYKDIDTNFIENLGVEARAMEQRTASEVISNNEGEILPDSNSYNLPSVSITERRSTANSSFDEELDDDVEAICGSEVDVDIEKPSDPEDVNVNCCELEHNADNTELENGVMFNVGGSSREVRSDSHDISSKAADLPRSHTKFNDNSENATLNEGTERYEPVKVVDVPLDAPSQPNHRQDCSVRPKRKRKASSSARDDETLEVDGRRRSSRVKQKEEQKLEEEKKRKEELEKISCESLEQKSPEVKRKRKSRKIAEDSPDSERKRTSDNEKTCSETSEMGESKTWDVVENVYMPLPDSNSVIKTENSAEKEEVKVERLPQIDEDYINSSLLWTEKYAPSSHDDVIGNKCQTRQVFEWLSIWKEKHERFVMKFIKGSSQKFHRKADCSSDFDDSSDDEDDEPIANTFVIIGKVGCGSTATVYACAQELGYKVLEMHPSNFRSGKQIQSLLGEATQSHQVKRKFHGSGGDNSSSIMDEAPGVKSISSYLGSNLLGGRNAGIEQNNDDVILLEKKSAEDSDCGKEANPDIIGGEMSLVLFEQADIVFDDQDKGFWFGLNELRRQAKRPILITANDSSLITKLDGESFEVVTMNYVEEQLIVDHLQVLCVAEHVRPSRLLIEKIVKDCKNDIRKSILKLQFICEQWMKPCYTAMDRVIKDSSIVDLTNDLDTESTDDANPIQDSRIREYERADLRAKASDSASLVPVNESAKAEEIVTSIATEVVPCMSQAQDLSSKGLKVQEFELKAIHIKNSLQYQLEDLKGMETDGKEVNLPRDSCETRVVLGELKSEVNTSEFKATDEDTNSMEKNERNHEVAPVKTDEVPRNEKIFGEIPMIALIENDIGCNWEDENCLFDTKKVDKYSLCQLNPNRSQKEKNILVSSSQVPCTLEMLSTSADALSFMDTLCNTWPHILASPCSHRHGWWHAKTLDGITDDERLSEDGRRHDIKLEEIYKSTADAFQCVHRDILGEHDTESCSLWTRQCDVTLEIFSALEDRFPQSVRTDHRSLCVDTYPSLLNICKSEEFRKASQFGRRSRRFLHYLDTIGLHLDSDLRRQLLQTSLVEDSNLTCK